MLANLICIGPFRRFQFLQELSQTSPQLMSPKLGNSHMKDMDGKPRARVLFLGEVMSLNACAAINTHLLSVWSLAGYVEVLASKLGMQVPDLTPKQVDMWQTRLSSHMVRFFLWVLFWNPLHVLIRSGNKRGMMGRKRKQEFMLLYLRASRALHFSRLLNKVLIIISCTYHNR